MTCGGCSRRAMVAQARAMTTNVTSSPERTATPCSPEMISENSTIGPNSPIAPAPRMQRPSGVSSSPASRRIGSRVPTAVVLSTTATSTGSATSPAARRPKVSARASPTDSPQPAMPSCSGRPRSLAKSSSMPARKNRNDRPSDDSARSVPSVSTRSRTCGPMTTPKVSSRTTSGRRRRTGSSLKSGASAATNSTSSRE